MPPETVRLLSAPPPAVPSVATITPAVDVVGAGGVQPALTGPAAAPEQLPSPLPPDTPRVAIDTFTPKPMFTRGSGLGVVAPPVPPVPPVGAVAPWSGVAVSARAPPPTG